MSKSSVGFSTAYKLRQDLEISATTSVDLQFILEKLMIKLIYKDLGRGIDGACKSEGIKKLIVLNPNIDNEKRKRFTLAHEIGHLLIHHNAYLCNKDCFRAYKTQSNEEREANDFAAELLLPQNEVSQILNSDDLTFELIKNVAEKYNTSLFVAGIRLAQLFKDNAMLVVHDGYRVSWKVPSNNCFLKISDIIAPNVLANKTNDNNRHISGEINSQCWLENDIEDLICEEESHYFSKLKRYLTILKFYENY